MKDYKSYKMKRANRGDFVLKPIEPDDMDDEILIETYINGIFNLFSSKDIYKWNPHVQISSLESAKKQFENRCLLRYLNKDFTYWIFEKLNGKPHKLIGNIVLFPYQLAKENGRGENYSWMEVYYIGLIKEAWIIEYYIHPEYSGFGICTDFTKFLVDNLFEQGFPLVIALVNRRNYASVKILENIGFRANQVHKIKAEKQNINERFYTFLKPSKNDNLTIEKELKQVEIGFKNGDVYHGTIYENNLNGKGKMFFQNREIYEGEFFNGKRHGKGKYIYPDGEYYVGDFVNGKYEGNGKYFYVDGKYYIGEFKNDLFHGKGVIYDKNGNVLKNGNWEEDQFIGNFLDNWYF